MPRGNNENRIGSTPSNLLMQFEAVVREFRLPESINDGNIPVTRSMAIILLN